MIDLILILQSHRPVNRFTGSPVFRVAVGIITDFCLGLFVWGLDNHRIPIQHYAIKSA